MLRPAAALTLALVSVSAQGCFWGTCGDRSFTGREVSGTYDLAEDGTVDLYGEAVDPRAEEGCAALCEALGYYEVESVDTCAVTDLPADEGAADTDTTPAQIQVDCTISGSSVCIGGRHHADLGARPVGQGADPVGAWLSREAHGEAGSVIAFARLARELAAHGAPAALVRRALEASRDEVRHARDVRTLARAYGGRVGRLRARPARDRALVDLAVENAVEGCVLETFAAALAGWQARHADGAVQACAARIAPDEAAHAELAWDLHQWLCGALTAEEAARVEQARVAAWAQLIAHPPVAPAAVRAALGLPDAGQARALAQILAAELRAAA